jgi:hypothetical protein
VAQLDLLKDNLKARGLYLEEKFEEWVRLGSTVS